MRNQEHLPPGFSITLASGPDYERLFAEIYYDEKFVLLVSQENGPEDLLVEIPGPGLVEERICREVSWQGLLRALEAAAQILLEDE